ncbi:MAG: polysaccharide deacetylase family protein [Rhodospirillales bacterium]|nr:polysaccharide deacetylase family protein [Rhodospirillales bacterium]
MMPPSLILLFHAVGTPDATGYKDAVSAKWLERALAWLQRHYSVVSLDDLVARRQRGESLKGLAALTFDDNHRSIAEVALPLVAARGLPATWFLMTAPLGGAAYWRRQVTILIAQGREQPFRAFLQEHAPEVASALRPGRFYKDSKDPRRVSPLRMAALLSAFLPEVDNGFVTPGEVAALALPGVTLGNHSHRHLVMAGLRGEEQRREIAVAGEALSHYPQPKSRVFGVPFGGPGSYDADTLRAVAAAGLATAAVTTAGLKAADDVSGHTLLAGGDALVRCLAPALRSSRTME